MTIQVGDRLPEAQFNVLKDGVQVLSTEDIFGQGKVLLFAVPGAFTPTCSARHLPGYTDQTRRFAELGIRLVCIAVNDAFVMDAWGKSQNTPDDILMLADGNAEFTRALGLELDASGFGMGIRSKRYALYSEDGTVKGLWVEAPGEFKVSAAEYVLTQLTG
ncbi:MAG: peroxiredoxin [Xanthomonadales bacterium]|nr:peroxiredoxin [Xanthomonadales bacterium]